MTLNPSAPGLGDRNIQVHRSDLTPERFSPKSTEGRTRTAQQVALLRDETESLIQNGYIAYPWARQESLPFIPFRPH